MPSSAGIDNMPSTAGIELACFRSNIRSVAKILLLHKPGLAKTSAGQLWPAWYKFGQPWLAKASVGQLSPAWAKFGQPRLAKASGDRRPVHLYDLLAVLDLIHEFHLCPAEVRGASVLGWSGIHCGWPCQCRRCSKRPAKTPKKKVCHQNQSLADHGWPCPTFRRPWLAMANAWPTMAGHGWQSLMFGRPMAGWPCPKFGRPWLAIMANVWPTFGQRILFEISENNRRGGVGVPRSCFFFLQTIVVACLLSAKFWRNTHTQRSKQAGAEVL